MLGVVLAGLGGGGGLFLVPLFVLLFDEPISRATGNALVVIAAASLLGALRHWYGKRVRAKLVGLVGGGAVVGAIAGAIVNPLVPPDFVLGGLVLILVSTAIYMLKGKAGAVKRKAAPWAKMVPIGVLVGAISGFSGVGGGFLMVPALMWGTNLKMSEAIGTSVAIMALTTLSGAVTHLVQGNIAIELAGSVGVGAVFGALLGASISGKVPERPMRISFAIMMLVAAVILIVRR